MDLDEAGTEVGKMLLIGFILYELCTFWLGGDVAGNNQNQIDGEIKKMELTENMEEFLNDLIGKNGTGFIRKMMESST